MEEMAGSRREEYEAAARDAGMTRHEIWHQQTPEGTLAVVYVEGDDAEAAAAKFGSSDEPFNQWFRERMKDVHGIDISQPLPSLTKVLDVRL
jgi:hypothetical protein